MRIVGVDLGRLIGGEPARNTLVALDEAGAVQAVEHPETIPETAAAAVRLAGEEPLVLSTDVPIVVGEKPERARPVEGLARRRLGHKLAATGRGAENARSAGEKLLAALAANGKPCLPWPDRGRRQSGLAETDPGLVLKSLLWDGAGYRDHPDRALREELFRGLAPPEYRAHRLPARTGWAERTSRIDLAVRSIRGAAGFDLGPVEERIARAGSARDAEEAAGLLDAVLVAGTAKRYLDAPEACLFLGDRESGYVLLPADGFLRSLAQPAGDRKAGRLFPEASLRDRLGPGVRVRDVELIVAPGRPRHIEASFDEEPRYEFDNVDEMLWWKHCRHLAGPTLPTEGLRELRVHLTSSAASSALRLVRSRHRTLSFRFEPPGGWRRHLPTRDGRTYPFRVVRALYETHP